ncbi:MAG: YabP/YqfC family sporulation protein [Oscillospiraceae bacterium]
MERKESILEKTAGVFDLPADVVAGLPLITMTGDRELRMENHRGILAYGDEEICVSGGVMLVRICGSDLTLRAMNSAELVVSGHIGKVEFG